jgi:hypothetical protein
MLRRWSDFNNIRLSFYDCRHVPSKGTFWSRHAVSSDGGAGTSGCAAANSSTQSKQRWVSEWMWLCSLRVERVVPVAYHFARSAKGSSVFACHFWGAGPCAEAHVERTKEPHSLSLFLSLSETIKRPAAPPRKLFDSTSTNKGAGKTRLSLSPSHPFRTKMRSERRQAA